MTQIPKELKKFLFQYCDLRKRALKKSVATLDRSKLVPKKIVDKTGKKTTVYINPNKDEPTERDKIQQVDKRGLKQSKEEIILKRVEELKQKYPHLSREDIRARVINKIPMDATNIKIYTDHPKYICEYRDNKGRLQQRYTQEHIEKASQKKFKKLVSLHDHIPEIRKAIQDDLNMEGLGKNKICSLIVNLIDKCYFRVGNDRYAEQNETYGVSTLKKEHLKIDGDTLEFNFVGKARKEHQKIVTNEKIAGIMKELVEKTDGDKLFQYKVGNEWFDITYRDIRSYLGKWGMTPKDFRTYHATRICATELAKSGAVTTEKDIRTNIKKAIEKTAEMLGHTPAICKKYYIFPRILEAYENGVIMKKYVGE